MKIFVQAKPNAKIACVEKIEQGLFNHKQVSEVHFKVSVKEEAKNGRANEAIIKALAEHFNVAPSRVRLISGFSSKNKIFKIS